MSEGINILIILMHAGIKYGNDTEGENKRSKRGSIEEIERLKCMKI